MTKENQNSINTKSNVIINEHTKETIVVDENGNETKTIITTTSKKSRSTEPDYIKIYTDMWCKFNSIPSAYTQLFLSLVTRMSYCNSTDLENSQLVNTCKPWSEAIMKECGWTSDVSLKKGLQSLCKANAIKRVGRGVYQINPNYAGKGTWKYDPRLKRGGIEDLKATFDFKNGTVDTKIIWADDGKDNEFNEMYRQGLGVNTRDNTILKTTETKLQE